MIVCPDQIATDRDISLLADDMRRHEKELQQALHKARVCVIGGAGSIGSATVNELARYPLDELVIIDQNENALANLIRTFRSAPEPPQPRALTTLPFDYASELGRLYFQDHPPFDFILNFAALKHVRTEKDAISALALIDANVLKQARFLSWIADISAKADYFTVSTDKAANPVSFMGATKRLMEHVVFNSKASEKLTGRKVSARFANVAYSNGSLLESFADRMRQRVPLAAPIGISRYFISMQEAGELCLLAAILGESERILIPRLAPEEHLIPVEEIARRFLAANGYEADVFTLEEENDAKASVNALAEQGKWPLILTPADTAGEKPYEEFAGDGETPELSKFHALLRIPYQSGLTASEVEASLEHFTDWMAGRSADQLSLDALKQQIADLEPRFADAHISSAKRLDDRI